MAGYFASGRPLLSVSLCLMCACVCMCVYSVCNVWEGCACGCTVWGGCTLSDQKQSALVQSVSVPTFTHKRQGTQVCQSAQTYTYTHVYTLVKFTHTHFSHTSHTHPPSSRHPVRPLTIGQVPEPSASPSRLTGPFGKAGDGGKSFWCYLHLAGWMALWCRGLGRKSCSAKPSKNTPIQSF